MFAFGAMWRPGCGKACLAPEAETSKRIGSALISRPEQDMYSVLALATVHVTMTFTVQASCYDTSGGMGAVGQMEALCRSAHEG